MLKHLLTFDSLITPKIIIIIYWFCILCSILLGLLSILNVLSIASIIRAIIIIIGGILTSRVYCELILVIFKIHDQLKLINENTKQQ